MPHLKCYENGCHSNYCAHCVLDSIKVGLDAYCHSYRPKEEETKDDARCEYEFARDMGYAANIPTISAIAPDTGLFVASIIAGKVITDSVAYGT